ncbi:unnamed protein product, partial [Adineta ricciae]
MTVPLLNLTFPLEPRLNDNTATTTTPTNIESNKLKFECKNNVNRIIALNSIKTYLHNRKNRRIKQIYINMSDYRKKLVNYRKRSLKAKKSVGVSPKPIFYLFYNPFNDQERAYISKGPNYIRINQSAVVQNRKRPKLIQTECNKITKKVKDYLAKYHHVGPTQSIHNIFSKKSSKSSRISLHGSIIN